MSDVPSHQHTTDSEVIRIRKEKVVRFLKEKYHFITYAFLALIVWISVYIRTRNLSGLRDITTGGWTLGPDLDPFLFLRWSKYIVKHGSLYALDTLRYVPLGFNTSEELLLHPYMMAYFHKIAVLFGSQSVEQSAALYPVFFFALTVIAFFFMVRLIFLQALGDKQSSIIALIASFFLTVIPALLPRTIAGIPEKESAAFLFMFLAFYFFIASWKSSTSKGQYGFAVAAGIATALMALIWGGFTFIFVTFAIATLITYLFGQATPSRTISYGLWLASTIAILWPVTDRFTPQVMIASTTTGLAFLVAGILLVDFLIKATKSHDKLARIRLFRNLPFPVIVMIISFILGLIAVLIFFGPQFIPAKGASIYRTLVAPVGDRLGSTVAENRQPFFNEWASEFGPTLGSLVQFITFGKLTLPPVLSQFLSAIPLIFLLFFIGSIYLFAHLVKDADSRSDKIVLVSGYTLILFAIIFSRFTESFISADNSGLLAMVRLYILAALVALSLLIYHLSKEEKSTLWALPSFVAVLLLLVLCFGNTKDAFILNGGNSASLLLYLEGFLVFILLLARKGIAEMGKLKEYYTLTTALGVALLLHALLSHWLMTSLAGVLIAVFAFVSLVGITRHPPIKKMDTGLLMVFTLFFLSIVAARGAVRLIMVLVPSAAIIISYFAVSACASLPDQNSKRKRLAQIGVGLILVSLAFSAYALYDSSEQRAHAYVPYSYTQQWQSAMAWVRTNTPTDAVFAHWWDYGYWVQSIGERATVLDGGNAIPYWNHLMGRLVLTGYDRQPALEYLYTHKATHLLIDSTDIGKYSAFSRIGSAETYDRQSYFTFFGKAQVQEAKNATQVFYDGGFGLDQDIVYDEPNGTRIILPEGKAGLGRVIIRQNPDASLASQPMGVFVYQKSKTTTPQQYTLPLRYAYKNGALTDYKTGIEAGVMLIDSFNFQSNQIEKDAVVMYLSNKTVNSNLARLYLYNLDDPNFKLVHSEEDQLVKQLKAANAISQNNDFVYASDQGIHGPIRIWEIKYPAALEAREEYLELEYPDQLLTKV